MANEFPELTFSDQDDFNAERLNRAMRVIDARLRRQEGQTVSYDEAIDTLNRFGLQRLNEAVQPVYDKLTRIAQIGLIFSASSQSPQVMNLGLKTFQIADDKRTAFAPTAYIQARRISNSATAMFGQTQSYDPATGQLIVLIDQTNGAVEGPVSDWNLMPASTPDLITDAYTRRETDALLAALATNDSLNALTSTVSIKGGTLAGLVKTVNTLISTTNTDIGNRLRFDTGQSLSTNQVANVLGSLAIQPFVRGLFGAGDAAAFRLAIGAQATLGFTPVQQGGGLGQASNKVYLGWGDDRLKAQVDALNLGSIWVDATAPVSLAANGYQFLPSGLILQWGYGQSTGADFVVPYNVTFPNSLYCITATPQGALSVSDTWTAVVDPTNTSNFGVHLRQVSNGGSVVPASGVPFNWFAIGR